MSNQDRALELLLTGKTAAETARLVGVDERTVRRWKKTPGFAEELSELRQEIHDEIMLRVAALIEKLQTAAFAQLEWLKAMADKLPALTDKLRCINAISQLNFKWSKFIMEHQDRKEQKTLAAFAKLAQKADKTGREQHGATGAPTAPSSVHPCPDDSPTQKADGNGHQPQETPSKSTETASPSGTDESGIKHPDASVAPWSTEKAVAKGHAVVTQASSLQVSGDSQAESPRYGADTNGHPSALDPELQALKAHRARLAASGSSQKRA